LTVAAASAAVCVAVWKQASNTWAGRATFVGGGSARETRAARLDMLSVRAAGTPEDLFRQGMRLWDRGNASPEQTRQAISLVTEAADGDFPMAQHVLGQLYYVGRGVEKNPEMAVDYWKRAAALSYPESNFMLGNLQLTGTVMELNKFEAAKCFKVAAEAGHQQATQNLARMLALGDGIPQDREMAGMWLHRMMNSEGGKNMNEVEEVFERAHSGKLTAEEDRKMQEKKEQLAASPDFMKIADKMAPQSGIAPDEWEDDRGQV
jgi:TPR repeat protein